MSVSEKPLADECSLCGLGQYDFHISVADEPIDGEYRWAHVPCLADHGKEVTDWYRREVRNSSDEPRADGEQVDQSTDATDRTTYIDEDGLRIPREVRDFKQQLVIRTPRSTIQHFGSGPMDPFYPLVDASDFGPVDEFRDPKNPNLAPDKVSIKPQGEDAITYTVDTEVDR